MNPVIEVVDLVKSYGTRRALAGISFKVFPGDIFGYIGPNGAGKTTTLRVLVGLLSASSGNVSVLGRDPYRADAAHRARIAAVLETSGLYADLTVRENLRYYAEIYSLADRETAIDAALEFSGLSERAGDYASRLSKGMRQILAIARQIMHDPEIIFFDEPTANLDPVFQEQVRGLIVALSEQGKTVFLNSHNLPEVDAICNRVAFINEGLCSFVSDIASIRASFAGRKFRFAVHGNPSRNQLRDGLACLGEVVRFGADCEGTIITWQSVDPVALADGFARSGFSCRWLTPVLGTLEDAFREVVK